MKWKEIKISNGKYSVSDTGLIKRNQRIEFDKYKRKRVVNERIIKPCIVGAGYLSVSLRINFKTKKFYIHRLVAIEFLKNDNNKLLDVNHKDLNKNNNYFKNLEWVTKRQNSNHYFNSKNPGVTVTKNNKYMVRIMINGQRKYLGTFNNLEIAKNEYRKNIPQV